MVSRAVTTAYDVDHPSPTVAEWREMLDGLPGHDPYPVGLRIRITHIEGANSGR